MAASSLSLSFNCKNVEIVKSKTLTLSPNRITTQLSFPIQHRKQKNLKRIYASVSTQEELRTSPDDLVSSILSKIHENKSRQLQVHQEQTHPLQLRDHLSTMLIHLHVVGTDRGVSLPPQGHLAVAEVASQLQTYCVDKPVECPLIFGEWDVVYCSNPTSPGGGYRSALGRMVFKTKEMIQVVEAPDVVKNKVSFSAFGFLDGQVSLKGKLNVLDEKWIQVIFEPPELKVGSLEFTYGGESEVKLEITYVDEKIRLGKGSRGSLFVFRRC